MIEYIVLPFVGAGLWELWVRRWQRTQRRRRSFAVADLAAKQRLLPWSQKLKIATSEMMKILEELDPNTQRQIIITDPEWNLIHSSHTLSIWAKKGAPHVNWQVDQMSDMTAVIALRVVGGVQNAPSPVPDQQT